MTDTSTPRAMTQFAISLGVSRFPGDRYIPELQFAAHDAQGIHDVLSNELGYGERAHLLLEPNAAQVWSRLRQIGAQVRAGDTFVMYVAGHGVQHGGDQCVLLPEAVLRRVRAGVPGQDVLSLSALIDEVLEWPEVQCLFVLDVCRRPLGPTADDQAAGSMDEQIQEVLAGIVGRDVTIQRDRQRPDGPTPAHRERRSRRVAILNACSDGERAFEVESLGRGLLSLALERQLRAAATSNQHWMVTPGSAGTLQDEMQGIASELGHRVDQRPWLSELLSPVVLYRPPARPASPAPASASPPGMVMPSTKAAVAARDGIAANAGIAGPERLAAAPEPADELKVRYQAAMVHLQAGRRNECVPLVEALTKLEYPDALNQWAVWLAYGGRPEQPEKDPVEAERLWRRAIALGNLPAMGNLGEHLRSFEKSPERTQEGLSLLIQAAAQGLVSAAVRLSAIRAAEDEALQTEAKSPAFPSDEQLRKWLQEASLRVEAEDAWAWIHLATVAAYGAPGLQSPAVVDRFMAIWSRASVDDGPGELISEHEGGYRHAAMVLAAHLLSLKTDLSSADSALPRSLLSRLAKSTGGLQPGAALLHFAWSAEGGYNGFAKSAPVAEALLRTGSDNHAPGVLFALSERFFHGTNLIHQYDAVPTDEAKALDYLRRAAELGHAEAMVDLVQGHSHGYRVAKDFRLARQWADRAMALNLSPLLLAKLGECFLTGEGAMHDDETAATIYYRCLHQGTPDTGFYGQPDAMLVFGLMHWFGKGLKQDREAGQQWFNRSVDATRRETWRRSSPEARAAEQEFRIGLALASPRDDYLTRCHHLQLLHRMGADRQAARSWNERSAAHGNQNALGARAHSLAGADEILAGYNFQEFPDLGLRWEPAQAEEAMQHLLKSGHARAGWMLIQSLSTGASTPADGQLEAIFERLFELVDDKAAVAQAADTHFKAASTSPDALRLRALWSQRALQHRPPAQLADADTTGLARQPGESALGQLKRLADASSADNSPSAIEAFRLTDSVELANVLEARLLRARWLMRGFGTDADCDAALAVMQDCVTRFGASHRLDLADGIAGLFIGDRWDSLDTRFSDYTQVGALLLKLDAEGSFAAHLVQAVLLVEGCCGVPRDLERAQERFHALFALDAQRAEELLLDRLFDINRSGYRAFSQLLRRPPNAETYSRYSHHASLCATTAIFSNGSQAAKAQSAAFMADAFARGFITEVPKPHYIRQDEPDAKAAAEWLLRAAEAGDLASTHQLAEPLAKSKSSAGRALQWWAKAAEAGDLDAMAAIGVLLMDHPQLRSELPPEKASSEYWFDYAASVADAANLKIAQRLFKPGDSSRIELTTTWLQRSLDKAPSQAAWFLLAACRAHGMPGARGLEAADRCVETGLHLHGEPGGGDYERASALWRDDGPCPSNPDRVLRYLRLAADKGNISGDWELGQAFATGYGGKPDRAQAESFFLRCGNPWIRRSRLVYWWARWGRVDKWADADAFFRQDMANMGGQDESDCIYQLAFASLERAVTGKVALAEESGWLGYAFFKDANSDYRLPLQQAVFLMELPKCKASQIARARDCLDVAAKLVRRQPANDLIAVENELAFIETQRRKLATIKPMGWAARLAFRSPDPYL